MPAAWGERQQPLVSQGSPLFQRPTCQGFKEGNQIAAYDFALSMFWILRVCLIKGILCRQSVQSRFMVTRQGQLGSWGLSGWKSFLAGSIHPPITQAPP